MVSESNINSLPLSLLPYKTRKTLSSLLNTTKIIPSDGPEKLPRDWRGLASLVKILTEVAGNFHQHSDPTSKVLEQWRQNGQPTVGELLQYLQNMDRFDVHDDILADLKEYVDRGELDLTPSYQVALNNHNQIPMDEEFSMITFDDRPGYEHRYHAFVLYADEDKPFVDELIEKLSPKFEICTKERLLPGHTTEYAPVAQLISTRCQYVILVCSPDFFRSHANAFYRDYAQAVSIQTNQTYISTIIPVIYRKCQLPMNFQFYVKLYYKNEGPAMIDFWEKLQSSLERTRVRPRITGRTSNGSVNIMEMSTDVDSYEGQYFLLPLKHTTKSSSMSELDSLSVKKQGDNISISNYSQTSDNSVVKKKKKRNQMIQWFKIKTPIWFRRNNCRVVDPVS